MSPNNLPLPTHRPPRPAASAAQAPKYKPDAGSVGHGVLHAPRGFTIVELLIVVALMGIIAAVVIPHLEPGTIGQLESAGSILVSDLDYARQLAVANGSTYTVDFAAEGDRYTIAHSGSNASFDTLPESPFRRPTDPDDEHICRFADLPQSGASLSFVSLEPAGADAGVRQLEFGPLGSLTGGSDSTIWLAGGTGNSQFFLPVTVNAATGLARVGEITAGNPALNEASQIAVDN